MPTNTTNYNLVKPLATEFYDISVPNGNMDKIDAALKGISDRFEGVDLSDLKISVDTHISDNVRHITAAERNNWNDKIGYPVNQNTGEDLNNLVRNGFYIRSSGPLPSNAPENVAFYLRVLNRTSDDLPTQICNILYSNRMYIRSRTGGLSTSPWTNWERILTQKDYDELFQSVSNGKTLVANAITQKGVATSPTAEFATMANNIAAIPNTTTGKREAKGNLISGAGGSIVVSGLAFTPTVLIVFENNSVNYAQRHAVYIKNTINNEGFEVNFISVNDTILGTKITITSNGFSLATGQTAGIGFSWLAYG